MTRTDYRVDIFNVTAWVKCRTSAWLTRNYAIVILVSDSPSVPSPSQLVAQLKLGAYEAPEEPAAADRPTIAVTPKAVVSNAPFCMTCGVRMNRSGSCYVCGDCGSTSGCS